LSDINNFAVENTGIEWTLFGFKQSDSLNRRIMLRTYEHQSINEKSKKVYPLSNWKNRDVKKYIDIHGLIQPIVYDKLAQSQGTDICDINFLLWCKNKYPNDLKKIFTIFPNAEQIIFEHQYHEQYKTIGDGND
jgi:sulfate adenylyltransferase subunit 2